MATGHIKPPVDTLLMDSRVSRSLDTVQEAHFRRATFRWLLLEGNRLTIVGALLLSIFAAAMLLSTVGILSPEPSSPMYFLFSSLIGGNLTLITVVISINQLVLSRELGSPGELYQRIQQTEQYRDAVESTAGRSVSPVTPTEFLRYLHDVMHESTLELEESISVTDADDVRTLTDSLEADIEGVTSALEGENVDIFDIVAATLKTNHAHQIREIDRLVEQEGETFSSEAVDALTAVRNQLLQVDVARRYFRTVYTEKELAHFSRVVLYVGLPTQCILALMLIVYGSVLKSGLSTEISALYLPVAVTIGFAPLTVLFSFVLRHAWIAQHNASVAPFTTTESTYDP